MTVRHPQSPDCRCPLSNLWVGIHRKYLQGLPLTPSSLLEQRVGCQEWDRGSGICSPPPLLLITSPLPAHYTPSADPCLRCLHPPPDRQLGRWRRRGGGCRGSGPQRCSDLARECVLCLVCVCMRRDSVWVLKRQRSRF